MRALKDGIRSLVRIDFSGRVHKQFRGTDADKRCANEVRVLKELEARGCPYVPQLLEASLEENYLVTTNCGRTAEKTISRRKADLLFQELEDRYGIRHDDPEPRNITYDDRLGRFCIIDFELAEILPLPEKDHCVIERLHWASATRMGRKHLINQDSHLCFTVNREGQCRSAENGEVLMPPTLACFSVSDGVGGNNGGEFASRFTLGHLRHQLEEDKGVKVNEESFTTLLAQTNTELNRKAEENENASRLSATYVGVIFQQQHLFWANVGDSRLYRYRGGTLEQLSKDHNFAFRAWKRGEISEFQYRTHPRKNILYDAMGGGYENISPVVGKEEWQGGDLYLICSDGIIDGFSDRKIVEALEKDYQDTGETDSNSLQRKTEAILNEAVRNAGRDDTTLILIQLED